MSLASSVDNLVRDCVSSGSDKVAGCAAMVVTVDKVLASSSAGTADTVGSENKPFTVNTPVRLFSCSKPLTCFAALQLVEQRKLELHTPAKKFVPEIGDIQVLEGFDESRNPILRPPKTDITLHHLLTHTSGFTYGFSNTYTNMYMFDEKGKSRFKNGTKASYCTPLADDPGSSWQYGVSIDWVGFMIERVTGQSLEVYLRDNITGPLGMDRTTFYPNGQILAEQAKQHLRKPDGSLFPLPRDMIPANPEVLSGGGGLLSTVSDYMKFCRMLLNKGVGPSGKRLLGETLLKEALSNQLPLGCSAMGLDDVVPGKYVKFTRLSPESVNRWSYLGMYNQNKLLTGRPAKSLHWTGLQNLYFWVDFENGIAGMWATQVLPINDPRCAKAFEQLETMVYNSIKKTKSNL
ncbi:hypothetical protein CANCADRAFT_25364 [Tortispora caseinolytica NRRL Y-17796]|uniref:Beta-lactamase-related domain-containing protein n=1 Tax=Tortispora caseinolytica NRRL Y-17796 TaxID=767744 RepID=A0A1E4TGQ6_9ASCO|nr:hypothetical protein CANCADRAFT_25364 [Tortispora caseinolytica NRRL Y-17796]